MLGDGAKEAVGRRDWAVRMEEVAVRERRAHFAMKRHQIKRRYKFVLDRIWLYRLSRAFV